MEEPERKLERIAVVAHPNVQEAGAEAAQIASFLKGFGVETAHGYLYDEDLHHRVRTGEFDILIALGGDGTMLRAGHLCGPSKVPILGVNLGRFGFLMEILSRQWQEFIPRLLDGEYWLEKRMMLRAEQWRADEKLGAWDVLNEVVVSRGQFVRPIKITAYVDNRFLATYIADGLIAATPTGSTAYALAVGGPIMPPELRNILIVPVAPHLSIERAIVLAEGSSVSISVETDHQSVLSVDGQAPIGLTNNDRVDVRAGEHTVYFVRFQDPGYFYRNLTKYMSQNPSAGNQRQSKLND
jgi:NAD+ kinase